MTKVLNFYGNNGYVTVRDDATCDKLGYEEIYTKESCAEGAEYLDLQDTSPSTLRNTYYVGGCWLYYPPRCTSILIQGAPAATIVLTVLFRVFARLIFQKDMIPPSFQTV